MKVVEDLQNPSLKMSFCEAFSYRCCNLTLSMLFHIICKMRFVNLLHDCLRLA